MSEQNHDQPGLHCGETRPIDRLGFRVSALFVILITSLIGTLFPIITKRVKYLRKRVPGIVFEFGKFFGSGVILATAIVHLLDPAIANIGAINTYAHGGCLSNDWADFPYPLGICTAALFFTFVTDLVAVRLGKEYLAKHGISTEHQVQVAHGLQTLDSQAPPTSTRAQQRRSSNADVERQAQPSNYNSNSNSASASSISIPMPPAGAGAGAVSTPSEVPDQEEVDVGLTPMPSSTSVDTKTQKPDYWSDQSENTPPGAQILGVAILEFGILFHSVIIGMTLALASHDEFTILYIVIIFHQAFEGLGLGTRLAFLQLPAKWDWVPSTGALVYSAMTPLGMAIGLGAQGGLSMTSSSAAIAGGVLDSVSAGILLYAATVELMAHEFVFNPYYHTCSWRRLTFVITCFALGTGLMSLLGKWA